MHLTTEQGEYAPMELLQLTNLMGPFLPQAGSQSAFTEKVMQVSCQFLWSRGLLGSASIASWFRSGGEGQKGVEIQTFLKQQKGTEYKNPNKREYNLPKQRGVEYETGLR